MKLTKTLTMLAICASIVTFAQESITEESGWRPTLTLRNDFVSGYYNRGVLWDTNFGDVVTVNIGIIDNLNLTLQGRIPVSDSKRKAKLTESIQIDDAGEDIPIQRKKSFEDFRDDDYDYLSAELSYRYTIESVGPIGDISLNFAYLIQKNADIYSKLTCSVHSTTKVPSDIVDDLYRDFNVKYKTVVRDEVVQEGTFGVSLDDVPLTPNASIAVNQDARYFIQMGLKYSLPCTFISEKLTFNNSLDAYYFSKDYFKTKISYTYDISSRSESLGLKTQPETESKRIIIHSKAGFKNIVLHSSLDFAVTEHIGVSLYGMAIQRVNDITVKDETVFSAIHKFEFLYGAAVRLSF